MFERVKFPRDIYMSPAAAVLRFRDLLDKHGAAAIQRPHDNTRVEKECLIAGEFLLGAREASGWRYFLQPGEMRSADVDVRVVALTQPPEPRAYHWFELQITEFESHGADLLTVIAKKIAGQLPTRETRELLVNIRDHEGLVVIQ